MRTSLVVFLTRQKKKKYWLNMQNLNYEFIRDSSDANTGQDHSQRFWFGNYYNRIKKIIVWMNFWRLFCFHFMILWCKHIIQLLDSIKSGTLGWLWCLLPFILFFIFRFNSWFWFINCNISLSNWNFIIKKKSWSICWKLSVYVIHASLHKSFAWLDFHKP